MVVLTLLFVLPIYNHIPHRQHPVCCTIISVQRKEENWLGNIWVFFFSEAEWIIHLMVISKNSWLRKIWWNTPLAHWTSYCTWLMLQVLLSFLHNPISSRLAVQGFVRKHCCPFQGLGVYHWMSQLQNYNTQIQISEACVRWASMENWIWEFTVVCWMRFVLRLIHLTHLFLASIWQIL